jgi:hypothetical protein
MSASPWATRPVRTPIPSSTMNMRSSRKSLGNLEFRRRICEGRWP